MIFLSLYRFFFCLHSSNKARKKAPLCPFYSLILRSLPLHPRVRWKPFRQFSYDQSFNLSLPFCSRLSLQCSIESPFGELRVWSVTWRFLGPSTFPKRSFVNENYLPFRIGLSLLLHVESEKHFKKMKKKAKKINKKSSNI